MTRTHDDEQSAATPGFVHGQLGYLQIPALDITTSARFYEHVFGWHVAPPGSEFEAPGLIGQWITDRPAAADAGPVGWFMVDDIHGTLEVAEREGAAIRDRPSVDGPRLLASFTDPAGNLVGLAQHGGHAPRRARPGRVENRTMPSATVIPQLVYDDVGEAIEWLCEKFGFVERWHVGDHRAQLAFGDGAVVVTEPRTSKALPGRQSVMVRVTEIDRHYEHARDRGATILDAPKDYPYGERQYAAEDLGGHRWHFTQSIADLAPEDWGGTSGPALAGS
jgi:uncharacterized glyoxalase superfamily protein PhnB/catechol 2,3-dioxygenase-like lactoylglutathione lyase family enzyme